MNAVGALLPDPLWQNRLVLSAMGVVAGAALGAGRIELAGHVPNGQWYLANPRPIWTIPEITAIVEGASLGPLGPLPEQAQLGDFWVPQRGILAIGAAYFEPFSPSHHLALTHVDESGQQHSTREAAA